MRVELAGCETMFRTMKYITRGARGAYSPSWRYHHLYRLPQLFNSTVHCLLCEIVVLINILILIFEDQRKLHQKSANIFD